MWPQEVKFEKKQSHSKFLKHLNVLMWKSYLQRVRRWRTLVAECIFALMMCILAIYIARPAFLTSLEAEPTPPVSLRSILGALQKDTILGYAPKLEPYNEIMDRTAEILGSEIIAGNDEQQLNNLLYKRANKNVIIKRVIWIIWRHHAGNNFKFSIRSTEVGALYVMEHIQAAGAGQDKVRRNPHLQAGFLSVECAINQALLEFTKKPEVNIQFTLKLVAMPVSPLMEEDKVRRAISLILMCYTLLLLPPVLETEALALTETNNKLKRALRIRDVDYSVIYLGWLTYAWLTAMPICLISGISLIVIFRWIHILYALITLLSYFTIMMTLAFMFSMFHEKVIIAAVWSILQTLTQTFLAELIVHHRKSFDHSGVTTFIFKTILPPLGLLVALNQFALLRTGRTDQSSQSNSVFFTILSWSMLFLLYFMLLMLLQRTIGSARAIGGQVSWKSIIFKQAVDKTKLRPIQSPNTERRSKLQEVDEMVAKAVSFNNVSKSIMEVQLLNQVSFDIYRGEFTSIFSERVQDQTITCVEDMLTGLTFPDSGTITVLGVILDPTRHMLNEHMMVGYCHQSSILIDDLTVEEHLHFYTMLCLWYEDNDDVFEFSVIRHQILKEECDLTEVYLERVDSLSDYYRAQLCWAIAILMEPRVHQFFDNRWFSKSGM
ncbi:hypothetical protein O0L34_g14784 [Tuta absoluta]|nr:hypothetical protein O0L34_g14784 [Tuta absoluta]